MDSGSDKIQKGGLEAKAGSFATLASPKAGSTDGSGSVRLTPEGASEEEATLEAEVEAE